jgi:hypothetical protein
MPTVLRIGPYRFHFYSREGNEPPHIHVTREEMEAKFWLRPVALASNHGFAKAELVRIEQLVDEHCQKLLEAAIAARLRSETTLPIKWIAARVQIGTAKGAKSVLPHLAQSQDQRKTASALEPCAQLEFQSLMLRHRICDRNH